MVIMLKLLAEFLYVGFLLQTIEASITQDKIVRPIEVNQSSDRATFQADYDRVWQTALNVLLEHQFQFAVKDKDLGQIETSYIVFSRHPRFSKLSGVKAFGVTPKLFLRKWVDGRIKVYLELNRLPDNTIQLIVRPDIQGFACTRFDDATVTGEWRQCRSNGKFEFELFNEIATKLKAEPGRMPSVPVTSSVSSKAVENPKDLKREAISASNLMLQSIPEGAEIYLNNELVGMTPSRISLGSGEYKVIFRKQGYKDYQREFVIFKDSDLTISTELERK